MNICKSVNIIHILLLIIILVTIPILCVEEIYADESNEVLRLVNDERISRSLQPLKMDKDLTKAAQVRNVEIITVFDHSRPDGSRFSTVSKKAKGENLAGGQKTPESVVLAWMKSPSHKKNLLNPRYTIIGISYKKIDTGYKTYWVQLFGTEKIKQASIEKVSVISVESKKNQISFRWKQQPQSNGYEIYLQSSKGKNYRLISKITKPSTTGLIINGLEDSTKYKFKIRSYMTIDKKTSYSPLSNINTRTKSK